VSPERSAVTVRAALGTDPVSIDPRHLQDAEGELVVRALFEGLVDVSPDGGIVPAGAEGWLIEDDGLTYRFRLGLTRFHDGEQVTAQHHADALLAVFDPDRAPRLRDDLLRALRGASSPAADTSASDSPTPDAATREANSTRGLPDDVLDAGGIEVIGPLELVLRLELPDPRLLDQLTDPALVPLPRAAHIDPEQFAREPIGNGPFRMAGPRERGAFIRLAANTDHHRPPRIDGLVLQVYAADPDRQQRWQDLLAGRLQLTAIPPDARDEARERFGQSMMAGWGSGLHETPAASLYAYAFAIDVAPFDDVRLRQAISASIDRVSLAAALTSAAVEPADAILPAVLGGSREDCAHCVHDPALARSLYTDWAADQPESDGVLRLVLTYPRGLGHTSIAERIAADVERTLGINVGLQSRDLAGFVRGVAAGETPLFRYGLRADFGGDGAASALLDPAFRPGAEENWVRWEAEGTAELLDRLGAARDPVLARELEGRLLAEAAVVPLLWSRHDLVVHPDVIGFRLDPTGRWWPELIRLR
jgi:oligopeptide transport system substrate-binding protein